MDAIDFIMAVEDGSIDEEQFHANVQSFVDSGIWRGLQGSWQRMVNSWAERGLCKIS